MLDTVVKVLPEFLARIEEIQHELITDEGLSKLIDAPTGEINKRSREGVAVDSQSIDLQQHLKNIGAGDQQQYDNNGPSQPIDSAQHLKKDNRGGRRYAVTGYSLSAVLPLLAGLTNLSVARTEGLPDTLIRASINHRIWIP